MTDAEKFDEGKWDQFEEELQTQVNTAMEEAFKVGQIMNPITARFDGRVILEGVTSGGGSHRCDIRITIKETDVFQDDL